MDCTTFGGEADIAVDQRNVARPLGLFCDIGSYESLPIDIFKDRFEQAL